MHFHRVFAAVLLCLVAPLAQLAVAATPWDSRVHLTLEQLQARTSDLTPQGYRPAVINAFTANGAAKYCDIWVKQGDVAWDARVNLSLDDLRARTDLLKGQGYRPALLSACVVDGRVRYSDLWEKRGDAAWDARVNLTLGELQTRTNQLKDRGFRPSLIEGCVVDGVVKYCDIWEQRDGGAWDARVNLSHQELQARSESLIQQGYRPLMINSCLVGGVVKYCDIWEKRDGSAFDARVNLTPQELQTWTDLNKEQGYRPVLVSGCAVNGGVRYCAIWQRD